MEAATTPENLKDLLHDALGKLPSFEQCALLDYPDHINIGDHLIWLGTVLYLTDILGTKINYVSSLSDFSEAKMERNIGKAPILFHGGGNLGDFWTGSQEFRERIISKYRDRPIIILPQSIYFADEGNLRRAASVFNSHPNLTLFTRDNYSHEIAIQYFYDCQIVKAPDMAFQMVKMPGLSFSLNQKPSILYHDRTDQELNQTYSQASLDLPNLVVEDWPLYKYYKENTGKGLNQLRTRIFSEGNVIPHQWLFRQKWKYFHPYSTKFNNLDNPSVHRKSWSYMHHGIYQFKQYPLIVTNRLHGHILCILLGIKHIFLPNSYYKNRVFHETWTHAIPFCRFVEDFSQIKSAVGELLELDPNGVRFK
jgi:pyruvyl transferase EpsO